MLEFIQQGAGGLMTLLPTVWRAYDPTAYRTHDPTAYRTEGVGGIYRIHRQSRVRRHQIGMGAGT